MVLAIKIIETSITNKKRVVLDSQQVSCCFDSPFGQWRFCGSRISPWVGAGSPLLPPTGESAILN